MQFSGALCCLLLAVSFLSTQGFVDPKVSAIQRSRNGAQGGQVTQEEGVPQRSDFWCKTCNVFVTVFDKILENREVEDFLIEYFQDHVCPALPEIMVDECLKDTPKFLPVIIHFIESLATARLCGGMGVCASSDSPSMDFLDQHTTSYYIDLQRRQNALRNQDQSACEMCRKVTKSVDEKLEDTQPDDIMDVKKEIMQSCTELPGKMQTECKNLVERWSYLLVYYLLKEKEDGRIAKACEDLNICPSTELVDVPALPLSLVKKIGLLSSQSNSQDSCGKCMEIATKTEGSVSSKDFEDEIGEYITSVCSYVPPIKERCAETLKSFSDSFFDGLAHIVDPKTACMKLGFCGDGDIPAEIQYYLDENTDLTNHVKAIH